MKFSTYKTMLDETSKNILITENTYEYIGNVHLNSPNKIVDFMNDIFSINKCAEEYLYMLAYNTKLKLLGVFEVGHGTCNSAYISPREILIRALLCGACNIILVHNHPSGVSTPSKSDFLVTERLNKASNIVGINLQDHIIIGDDYYSFRENDSSLFECVSQI